MVSAGSLVLLPETTDLVYQICREGCVTKGPLDWCDARHIIPWTHGGPTNLDNLVLLCRTHHRQLHEPEHGWTARLGPDHLPEFIPPPWIDPTRRPRRNLYHLRT
jgi:HNH endonuclease